MLEATATNSSEDFLQALKDAIRKAEDSADHTDALVKWKLEEVTGEHGSIAGLRKISVKISYTL